ncbi:MAG TPA: hypothetical protein VJ764_02740 [Steroidobacteraceae bacterium]|nr:hypothetical protein [Steroidobacteraceae bacterium]
MDPVLHNVIDTQSVTRLRTRRRDEIDQAIGGGSGGRWARLVSEPGWKVGVMGVAWNTAEMKPEAAIG